MTARRLILAMTAAWTATTVPAQGTKPAAAPGQPAGSNPWNVSTRPPEPKPAAPASPTQDSTLSLRVYKGFDQQQDVLPTPGKLADPAYAVDVSAVMTTCPDGSRLVSALVIGGQTTVLDNKCPSSPRPTAPSPCDAGSWSCSTSAPAAEKGTAPASRSGR